jgi:hypothetical protein
VAFDISWHSFPVDVPVEKRAPCAFPGCGRPADLIEIRSQGSGLTPLLGNLETVTTPWCDEHAAAQGYDETRPQSRPPEHLNAFQRLIARTLTHGDSGSPAASQ